MQIRLTITRAGDTFGFDCEAELAVRSAAEGEPERFDLVLTAPNRAESGRIRAMLPAGDVRVEVEEPTPAASPDDLRVEAEGLSVGSHERRRQLANR